MRQILTVVLATTTLASPAIAQSDAAFSGFRLEAFGGLDEVEDDRGAVYGGALGFDTRSGNWVFGATAEVNDSSVEECQTSVVVPGDEVCAEAGREFYIGGRVGYVIADNLLLYGALGYTNSRFRAVSTEPGGAQVSLSENLDGARLALGLELNVAENAFARVELRGAALEDDFERGQLIGGVGIRF